MPKFQSANALPSEHVIVYSNTECSDVWFERPTCGIYKHKDGSDVWDSQVKIIIMHGVILYKKS